MVTLERETGQRYRCTAGCAALQEVANREKLLPGEYLDDFGVNQAFRTYAEPLIGGPLPEYVDFEPLLIEKLC